MSTATTAKPDAPADAGRHGTVRGFLELLTPVLNRMGEIVKVKSQLYQFVPVRDHGPGAMRVFRIHKHPQEDQHGKGVYTVSLMANGLCQCTCPDSIFREHNDCKHLRAMKALELLER